MDITELDQRDRRNLYKPDADNVHVVEMSVRELADMIGQDFTDELGEVAEKAEQQVKSHNEDRAFLVIKIVR